MPSPKSRIFFVTALVAFFGIGLFSVNTNLLAASASRLAIIRPQNTPVGTSMAVEIQAQDSVGTVDMGYQGAVTLVVSGSVKGAVLVKIVNGKGVAQISDMIAENVRLSLIDTQHAGLDVSSVQDVAFMVAAGHPLVQPATPSVEAGTGGSVNFVGVAFPKGRITIASQDPSQRVPVYQQFVVAADGVFNATIAGSAQNSRSFGVYATDPDGRVTPVKVLSLPTLANAQMVRNLIMAPTLGISRSVLAKGESLMLTGYAEPRREVNLYMDGELLNFGIKTGADGRYGFEFDTARLAPREHTAMARIKEPDGRESDASLLLRFVVMVAGSANTDYNRDGKVDLSDLSIFMYRWNSSDPSLRSLADLNRDGVTDISDFSIFIQTMQ
jgi:hypothetical protein